MKYAKQGYLKEPLLSICIPTYNRATLLESLLVQFLSAEGCFEVCVHDDGSSDHTLALLDDLARIDYRLRTTSAPNAGRAQALKKAIESASGAFIMLFDDDDEIDLPGLSKLLQDLKAPLPEGVAGYIYQMGLPDQKWVPFPAERSNFLKLRADERVIRDKKEVIIAPVMKNVWVLTPAHFRRVPTSLYWARIANEYDVLCRNVEVGKKNYYQEGISANIHNIKIANAQPMAILHRQRVVGFFKGRYRSVPYFLRSLVAWIGYSYPWLISSLTGKRSGS